MAKSTKPKKEPTAEQLAYEELARNEVNRLRASLRQQVEGKKILQRDIQRKLGWGPGYVSQMYGGSKELRLEPFILLLLAAEIEPSSYFAEHYQWGAKPAEADAAPEAPGDPAVDRLQRQLDQLRGVVDNVVRVLLERQLIGANDLLPEGGSDPGDDGMPPAAAN